MKKMELERILMDTERLKKLSERATTIKLRYGEGGSNPSFRVSPAQHLAQQLRPTPDESRVNDFDHLEKRDILVDIGRFLPELEKETPEYALELLTRKCSETPSKVNQILVEDAINRLVTQGKLDSQAESLVDEAIKVLGVVERPTKDTTGIDSIWTRLYQHPDYGGASYFVNHGPGWIYRRVRRSALNAINLNDSISSLYVDASIGEKGGKVILFQDDRFVGRYASFPTTPGATDERASTPYVGHHINDKTSSILIVRQYDNELAFSLGSLGLRDDIEELVSDVPKISLRGDPIITWDMWPSFSSDKRFIYLRIPIEVELDLWPNYDAEIRFWIYLYVDNSGSLHGYVDYYGAWVEGGFKSDSVLEGIMDALPGRLPDIQECLDNALETAALFEPFERQYFLPGTDGSTGHTNDDVTLVLVRR